MLPKSIIIDIFLYGRQHGTLSVHSVQSFLLNKFLSEIYFKFFI